MKQIFEALEKDARLTPEQISLVAGKTMQEIAVFVSEKLAPLETVQGTVTHFILKKYKEDGEILQGGEGIKRLPVTP